MGHNEARRELSHETSTCTSKRRELGLGNAGVLRRRKAGGGLLARHHKKGGGGGRGSAKVGMFGASDVEVITQGARGGLQRSHGASGMRKGTSWAWSCGARAGRAAQDLVAR